jgi:uncharacterized protein with FMN-binding domain
MRRAVLAVIGTVAGLAALLGYKSSGIPRTHALTAPSGAGDLGPDTSGAPAAPGSAPPGSAPATAGPTSVAPDTAAPNAGPPTTSSTRPTVPPTSPPSSSPAPTTTPSPPRVIDGAVEENRYGPVQVELTMQGAHIVGVKALQLPYDRARSEQISQYAAPQLAQEVLDAQSANIDAVSGATYTSQGYADSVQSALDQARTG